MEIDLKVMATKITQSPSARIAGELKKDCEGAVVKVDTLTKLLKTIITDPTSLTEPAFKTVCTAMKQVDDGDVDIQYWAARFGFADEKIKRGVKRKAIPTLLMLLRLTNVHTIHSQPLINVSLFIH